MIIQELIDQYQKVYQGRAWYGKNIVESLSTIPNTLLCQRLNGSYNIVELVHHVLAWRKYATHVLKHNEDYKVKDEENFPVINECDPGEWQKLLEELGHSQESLVSAMSGFDGSVDDMIPQNEYRLSDLLHSIIHHDIYHIGQINFMAKFLNPVPAQSSVG